MKENLGPAETIIQTVIAFSDHLFHGRPGIVEVDPTSVTGVRWTAVSHKVEADGRRTVIKLSRVGKKEIRTPVGFMTVDDPTVRSATGAVIGRYMRPGLFPEVAEWMYKQVARVWELDNDFAARWASYAHANESSRDLRTVLCAFMLCQSRKGDPVKDGGKVAFFDEDFRDVGEAMMLCENKDPKFPVPKLILRVHELLSLPQVAAVNRGLGFGTSSRRPFYGRWPKMVERWLQYLERNPKLLERRLKSGYRRTLMELAQTIGYRPETPAFYAAMRWKQVQAPDGRRTMAIGVEVKAAESESWKGLSEAEICEKIVREKPAYKRLVSLVPANVGITAAVMSAAVESGCVGDKDLIILSSTLEDLGLMKVKEVQERWEAAVKRADDMRAANVARNVRSQDIKEKLEAGADAAAQKIVAEVTKDIRIYVVVDCSGSMDGAIDAARDMVSKLIQAVPLDRIHVAKFDTTGREVNIPHASTAGVHKAFSGMQASGGTSHSAGILALRTHPPKPEEDSVVIWVGDEHEFPSDFSMSVRTSGLRPMAFGLVKVIGRMGHNGSAIRDTAAKLGIPCFIIDNRTFEDPYAIPRTIRNIIASTPVGAATQAVPVRRTSLVDTISKTKLIVKPTWASVRA